MPPQQLRANRRYAVLACGAVAAVLPGGAITSLLETLPLYVLFAASVLLARLAESRERRRAARLGEEDPALPPGSLVTREP